MSNNTLPPYGTPQDPDCQALDRGLKILAWMIASAYLRDCAAVEDKGVSEQCQERSYDSNKTERENENLS